MSSRRAPGKPLAKQNRQMPEHGADQGCLLDNRHAEAGIRFDALSELFDPVTFRHVDQLGIGAGMRCRKIGAGGPSVPLGPAERFGPRTVIATDTPCPQTLPDVRRHLNGIRRRSW
ncbi:hypothetical protein SAVCW2_10370 [Streptomyces avermitilis]|nr:hypothetical protein SAVCW2_10370 [Streptomyces avermitilis]